MELIAYTGEIELPTFCSNSESEPVPEVDEERFTSEEFASGLSVVTSRFSKLG